MAILIVTENYLEFGLETGECFTTLAFSLTNDPVGKKKKSHVYLLLGVSHTQTFLHF